MRVSSAVSEAKSTSRMRESAAAVFSTAIDSMCRGGRIVQPAMPHQPSSAPKVDCFYVYPTISRDPTPNSDWDASDAEEGYAAINQVARLRAGCRVFAPIYRQRTLGADHWQTATSRFNCGTAMRELGDPWGLTEMQSAADTLERLLGQNHPHVIATRSWLR